jgi:hypothetical protein
MNEKSLEKNLSNLERELVALQTAHEIGVGVVEYYEYNAEPPVFEEDNTYHAGALIEVADGERSWPFIEFWGGSEDSLEPFMQYREDGRRFAIYTNDIYQRIIRYRIVSTSILNIHYAQSIEEIQDWVKS